MLQPKEPFEVTIAPWPGGVRAHCYVPSSWRDHGAVNGHETIEGAWIAATGTNAIAALEGLQRIIGAFILNGAKVEMGKK